MNVCSVFCIFYSFAIISFAHPLVLSTCINEHDYFCDMKSGNIKDCVSFFFLQTIEVSRSWDCEIVFGTVRRALCAVLCAVCGHWRQHPGVCLVWLRLRSDRVVWVGPGVFSTRTALGRASHHAEGE